VSDETSVFLLRGDLENRKGNYLAAREAYDVAWQAAPGDRIAFKVFSVLQSAQRPLDEIVGFLDEWMTQLPDSEVASMTRANFLYVNDERDRAQVAYDAILEKNPENARALNNLAGIYGDRNQLERGLELSRSAYELADDQGFIVGSYGWFLLQTGDVPKAVEMLRKAVALTPDNAVIRGYLSDAEAEFADM
jgi:tetratricopeptide (TPR) repeat protein